MRRIILVIGKLTLPQASLGKVRQEEIEFVASELFKKFVDRSRIKVWCDRPEFEQEAIFLAAQFNLESHAVHEGSEWKETKAGGTSTVLVVATREVMESWGVLWHMPVPPIPKECLGVVVDLVEDDPPYFIPCLPVAAAT